MTTQSPPSHTAGRRHSALCNTSHVGSLLSYSWRETLLQSLAKSSDYLTFFFFEFDRSSRQLFYVLHSCLVLRRPFRGQPAASLPPGTFYIHRINAALVLNRLVAHTHRNIYRIFVLLLLLCILMWETSLLATVLSL